MARAAHAASASGRHRADPRGRSAYGLDAAAAEQVRWLRFPDRGPHELRLAALAEARGDVVAITEDHCDVTPIEEPLPFGPVARRTRGRARDACASESTRPGCSGAAASVSSDRRSTSGVRSRATARRSDAWFL